MCQEHPPRFVTIKTISRHRCHWGRSYGKITLLSSTWRRKMSCTDYLCCLLGSSQLGERLTSAPTSSPLHYHGHRTSGLCPHTQSPSGQKPGCGLFPRPGTLLSGMSSHVTFLSVKIFACSSSSQGVFYLILKLQVPHLYLPYPDTLFRFSREVITF